MCGDLGRVSNRACMWDLGVCVRGVGMDLRGHGGVSGTLKLCGDLGRVWGPVWGMWGPEPNVQVDVTIVFSAGA